MDSRTPRWPRPRSHEKPDWSREGELARERAVQEDREKENNWKNNEESKKKNY